MPTLHRLILAACLLACALLTGPANAQGTDIRALVNGLGSGGYVELEKQIQALVVTGDPAAAATLDALSTGDLYVRKSDKAVFIARPQSDGFALTDPLTGEAAGEAAKGELDKIKVNNKLRGLLRTALGSLTLMSPDPAVRRTAVASVFQSGDATAIPLLDAALASEKDASIAALMRDARAAVVLKSDLPDDEKIAAIEML
ncbi:MAG: urea ABC transporter permease subunit UrtB, partial [Bauldia sp.]